MRRLARNRLSAASRSRGRGWFLADANTNKFTPTVQVEVRRETADELTAQALNIEVGANILIRSRLMCADDVPVQIAVSCFPASLVAGTRIEDVDTGGTGVWGVLTELGYTIASPVEIVCARTPNEGEREVLGLDVGAPVLTITRVAYDVDGTPLEVNYMVLAADQYELAYEVGLD